jgi:ribosomal protein S18 acetylase RimI-like enzyme
MTPCEILPACLPGDVADAAALFKEYAAGLDIDLGFQGFAAELAGLPGEYAPPSGELLLARAPDGTALGCVGLRPLAADGICEMKRLYVRPEARGLGLGAALVAAIIAAAEARCYREMRLDSLPSMGSAVALYRRFGFVDIAAYCYNPVPGALFLGKVLQAAGPGGGRRAR